MPTEPFKTLSKQITFTFTFGIDGSAVYRYAESYRQPPDLSEHLQSRYSHNAQLTIELYK